MAWRRNGLRYAERNGLSIHEEFVDASARNFPSAWSEFLPLLFAIDENFLDNDTPEVPVVTRRISS